jgi:hypothetical protein
MSFNPPKLTHFRAWEAPSPLAAKRRRLDRSSAYDRRLDSSDAEGPAHGSDDASASVPGPPPLRAFAPSNVAPIASQTQTQAQLPRPPPPTSEGPAHGSNDASASAHGGDGASASAPGPPPLWAFAPSNVAPIASQTQMALPRQLPPTSQGPAYGGDDASASAHGGDDASASVPGPPPLRAFAPSNVAPIASQTQTPLPRPPPPTSQGPVHGSDDASASVPGPPPLQASIARSNVTCVASQTQTPLLRPPPPPSTSHDTNRHWLDSGNNDSSGDPDDQSRGVVAMALKNCLRMSPTDGDSADVTSLQKLSPSFEPPVSLFTREVSSPAGPAQQTGMWVLPTSFEPPTGTDCDPRQLLAATTDDLSLGMRASLAALEADSQAARLAHTMREQSDKATAKTYKRHVDRYERWWQGYQAERASAIPGWTMIPAFPITAARASMFLGYESTREKVCLLGPHPLVIIH